MEKKLDINNVKEALEFGYALYIAGKDVFGAGLDLTKLPSHLVPLYTKAIPAIEGIGEVVPELADLDSAEAEQLVALIASKGVEDAKVQEIIEKSLICAISVYKLVKAISA